MKTVVLLLLLLIYGCSENANQAPAPPVQNLPVLKVLSTSEVTFQEYPATIEGTVNVEVRPQVEGILDQLLVDEGSFVQKGQVLFKINDRPYREQLNGAKASLLAAKGALENAQLEIEKLKPLVKNMVISEFQLKTAKAAYSVATANLEQAKANVATAQINLGYTAVKAPVSGYIGRLLKKQGSLVRPTDPMPLTDLSDVHEVRVYFSLGESDFIKFKEQYQGGSLNEKLKNVPPVTLVLADQSTYSKPGRIDMIDGRFDKNTGSITIRASFPNAQGLLRSGNTGKVRLSLKHDDAILVPQSATLEIQDKIFVYTVGDSNKVSKQPITVAGKSGTNYLIREGLKTGDRIVYKGIDNLQEGEKIQPENAMAENLVSKTIK